MQIKKEIGVDYGHTLPNHFSFCSQIHGHRARVIAIVEGAVNQDHGSSSQGMLLDFKFLKEAMMTEIHEILDHGFAVWGQDTEDVPFITKRNKKYLLTDEPPTAEYLAKWAFYQLLPKIPENIKLISVEWFETPTSSATYQITE